MIDDPRRSRGRASRVSATSEYAEMSSASAKPSREVSTNAPSSSSRRAKASAWTRMSSDSWVSPHRAKTRAICSSEPTSQGSMNVEPIDSAGGRTRFSMRLSTDENPTSAPSAWSASAMPHAIEWSLATPKMSAVLPSSSPIDPPACGRRRAYHRAVTTEDLRTALRGVRGLVLDADGVLVLQAKALPGSVEAVRSLDERGVPFRVVTNFSQLHRDTLSDWFAKGGVRVAPDRIITAASATAAYTATGHAGRTLFVLAGTDARREFDGQALLTADDADALPPGSVGAVVIGDGGDELSYRNLDVAFRLVHGGAELLAMHRNPWWLTGRGITLDAGAYVAGLEYATGRTARTLGKPSPDVFRQAVDGLRADLDERLPRSAFAMVGDDPKADVAAAQRVGLRGILVLSGKTAAADVADVAAARRRGRGPDAVAQTLAEVVAALD